MRLGVNVTEAYVLKQADRQAVFAAIKSAGINDVRVEFPWKGVASSLTVADAVVADADSHELNVLGMVCHGPSPTPSAADFGKIMGRLADRYQQITEWQVWNEQNSERFWPKGNPEKFAPYLKAAYGAIKATNPAARVVLGGLAACASHSGIAVAPQFPFIAWYTNVSPSDYLRRLIAAGGVFDVVATHPYTWDAGFRPKPFTPTAPFVVEVDKLRTVLDQAGLFSVPIWPTEYGFNLNDFTVAQQATGFAVETSWLATRTPRGYLYCWRDNGSFIFGLVDKNNVARPALQWLREYIQ